VLLLIATTQLQILILKTLRDISSPDQVLIFFLLTL